jgi:tetratricopeptide (TPR) repeat protein
VALAALVPLLLAAGGDGAAGRFHEGAASYRTGDYPAAEQAWRDVLESGTVDGHVLYDLGNALFKQDRLGGAILAWRRAQLLLPRDPDVRANLDLARERVADAVVPQGHVPALLFWQHSLALGESAALGALLGGLALGVMAWMRWRRRRHGGSATGYGSLAPLALAAGLLAGLLLASTVLTARALKAAPPAVVLAAEAAARSAVGADGVELFVLHEGAEVRAVGREFDHVLVALPDGRRGWLPEAAVGLVLPEAGFPALPP